MLTDLTHGQRPIEREHYARADNAGRGLSDYREAFGKEHDDVTHRCPDLSRFRGLSGIEARRTLEQTINDIFMTNRQTAATGY